MATLLSKMDSSYRQDSSLSDYNLAYLQNHLEKPGVNPATVRLALVLLASLTVAVGAVLSVAGLVLS